MSPHTDPAVARLPESRVGSGTREGFSNFYLSLCSEASQTDTPKGLGSFLRMVAPCLTIKYTLPFFPPSQLSQVLEEGPGTCS